MLRLIVLTDNLPGRLHIQSEKQELEFSFPSGPTGPWLVDNLV